MLESQPETLEEPEHVAAVNVDQSLTQIVAEIRARLRVVGKPQPTVVDRKAGHPHGLTALSTSDSWGTDFNRLRAATGRANGIGLSLL